MADKPLNQTAASAPATGTPAGAGQSTEGGASAPVHLNDLSSFESVLAEELAGPEQSDESQTEEQAPGKNESTPTAEAGEGEETPDADTTEGNDDPANEEAEESTDDVEASDDSETAELTDEDDGAAVPKGMENWPKPAVKRIQNQSIQIKALKAQIAEGSIAVQPTAANPFADCENETALDERISRAKARRAWCRENPEGGTVKGADGKEYEITAEQAAAKLAEAERELEAYPDAKLRLAQRAAEKPWEEGERIAPGLLTKGTPENNFMLHMLKKVPEIKTNLPDYEIFLAAAARGMKMLIEERSGKARYVRMELDKAGKVIPAKQTTGKPAAGKPAPGGAAVKAAAKTTPPARIGTTKPALRAAGSKETVNYDDLQARALQGDDAAAKALLRAELNAA